MTISLSGPVVTKCGKCSSTLHRQLNPIKNIAGIPYYNAETGDIIRTPMYWVELIVHCPQCDNDNKK